MAIVATALAGLSLLLILISVPFQKTFAEVLSTSDKILDVLPQFPVIPFIFTFLRFGCIALLLICCGKQHGIHPDCLLYRSPDTRRSNRSRRLRYEYRI